MLITPQLSGRDARVAELLDDRLALLGGALERQVGVLDRDVIDPDAADALDGGVQGQPAVAVGGHAHLQPQPGVGDGTGSLGVGRRGAPHERGEGRGRGGEADETSAGKRGRWVHDRLLSCTRFGLLRALP